MPIGRNSKFPARVKKGKPTRALVDTRWVLTRKMVGEKRDVRARLVATGCQGPDCVGGDLGVPGCRSEQGARAPGPGGDLGVRGAFFVSSSGGLP